jgi:hypothetical protein
LATRRKAMKKEKRFKPQRCDGGDYVVVDTKTFQIFEIEWKKGGVMTEAETKAAAIKLAETKNAES